MVFLPGVDSTTLEADGSVRYYGTWNFAIGDKNEDLMVMELLNLTRKEDYFVSSLCRFQYDDDANYARRGDGANGRKSDGIVISD